jgi:hypothetical protein
VRQPKEQLEDKRMQIWENEKAVRMGSMLKVSLAFSIRPSAYSPSALPAFSV